MSITQRKEIETLDKLKDRNSTQHLEKILLSSSSSSSQRKLVPADFNKIILTTQDIASNGGGTQRTAHNGTTGMFNNTGRNWRKLITPAQDSLNKFQKQQPEYSGYNPGSRVTTQNDKPICATTNSQNTSMDTSNLSLSVKQFTPSQDVKQLKMTLRGGVSQHLEVHQQSMISEHNNYPKAKLSMLNEKNHLDTIQDEETKTIKQSYMMNEHFGASTSQMKSLIKSFSNGNFEFFDNLHKKYFENAKEKSQKSSKPPTSSQFNLDKSEKDLFNLTSKTNTQLGISQFKNSIESFGKSQNEKPSVLRASSLNDKRFKQNQEQTIKSAMSINFKNSLYKKINPSNALLDDNSQSQLDNKSKILQDRSLQRKVMQSFHLDSSDESSQDKSDQEDDKQPINLKSHIKKNQIEVLGNLIKKNARRDHLQSKDSLEDAIFKSEFNVLSRRDLSARLDDRSPVSDDKSQHNDHSQERLNKFHRNKPNNHENDNSWSRNRQNQQIDDSSNSLNLFHRLLSSGHNNNINQKGNSQMSSVVLSNPDFNLQSQLRQGENHIIFEQPTKEDALEDTYKGATQNNRTSLKDKFDLKAEDLTTIIENGCGSQNDNDSSLQSQQQDEILNTFKQHLINARTQLHHDEAPVQRKGYNSHKNSIQMQNQPIQTKVTGYQQSANPDRQRNFIGQIGRNSNIKDVNMNLDQKSDFTFVLSNPTDFQCECCAQDANQNNTSFVTNKFRKPSTAQNSDLKSQQQNLSSYRKGPFQTIGQPSRLQDFAASPIYSENGGPPGHQFYLNAQMPGVCQNCGGCKSATQNPKKQHHNNVQHRLSYNQINYQSIKEESQDEDDEYYQNQNFINSQVDDSQNQENPGGVVYNKVFDYQQQQMPQEPSNIKSNPSIQSNDIQIQSGETSVENNQNNLIQTKLTNQDEELKKLQTIISFSQEYMSKLLQDHSVSMDLKGQLAQVLGVISSVYQPSSQLLHNPSSVINVNHLKSNFTNNNNHLISQQTTLQPASMMLLGDNNMTISELQQIQRQQYQQQRQRINNHQQSNVNQIIHEEVSTQQDESNDVMEQSECCDLAQSTFNQKDLKNTNALQNNYQQQTKTTVNPKYSYTEQNDNKQQQQHNVQQLPKNLKKKYQNLKNSLISSSCEDPNFINKLKEDTVFSYVDQDDDNDEDFNDNDHDDDYEQDDDSFDREHNTKQHNNIKHMNAFNTLRQSEFHQSHYKSNFSLRKLKQSNNNGISHFRAHDIKKSLKKTKKSLLSTKQQLKKERLLNQQQEDKMRKLEAQIEALTERWKMTEDNIKAKENMIQLMHRINSQHSTSISTSIGGITTANTNTISKMPRNSSSNISAVQNSSNSFMQGAIGISKSRDTSPNMYTQTINSNNNCNSQNNLNVINQQMNSNSSFTGGNQLDQSSKHLLEINDRLTKQIEDNLALFEDLNQELTSKDKLIAENQAKLMEKQKEVELLTKRLNDMGDSMKQLIEITKSTSEATEQSKLKHQEEMEKIKRRQSDYQKKLDKINSVFANIPDITSNSFYASNNHHDGSSTNTQHIYSKYQKKSTHSMLGTSSSNTASNVLNCIPLSSPQSNGLNLNQANQSNNSSRIQDEEFSIGQIGIKQSIDGDILPQKLSQLNKTNSSYNKENLAPTSQKQQQQQSQHQSKINDSRSYQNENNNNISSSMLNSRTLNSIYNNLKESVKNYNEISNGPITNSQLLQQQQQNIDKQNNSTNESTMLKYSQDITHSLINTMNIRKD